MTREEEIAQFGLINVYPHMTPEEIARGEANKGGDYPASWVNTPYTPNEFYDPAYSLGYKPGSVPPWYIQVGNHWENPPGQTLVGVEGNQFFVTDPRGGGLYSYGAIPDQNVYEEGLGWRPRVQSNTPPRTFTQAETDAYNARVAAIQANPQSFPTISGQAPPINRPTQSTSGAVQNLMNVSNNQLWGGTATLPKATSSPRAQAGPVFGTSNAIDSLMKARGGGMDLWDFRKANRQ